MLRTDLFAFAAAEAIGRFAVFGGVPRAVIVVRAARIELLLEQRADLKNCPLSLFVRMYFLYG